MTARAAGRKPLAERRAGEPDPAILALVRALARQAAREDHSAEARQTQD